MGVVGSDSQLTLTPFQRQIIEAEENRRAEEQQQQMDAARAGEGGGQRPRNARASTGGTGETNTQSETVRYINTNENPEHTT